MSSSHPRPVPVPSNRPPSPESYVFDQASLWLGIARSQLQHRYEQARQALVPLWSALWNNHSPPASESHEALQERLRKHCEELERKLSEALTALRLKEEECHDVRFYFEKEMAALRRQMEDAARNASQREASLKQRTLSLVEDLRKRMTEIERERQERLNLLQQKLHEHRSAMASLHQASEACVTNVSNALSNSFV
ncbi:hypothetical protein KP509_32G037400 [Ceratopteris richardii]|uniref:Uncharacterized protein n=1 Tax=Ceratopteris richardii TaxID=49495 RepID=A0A8T2QT41_CERRI|nr:hypothetical protein KP509_32G037400 [Ceratopteris richardii]